MSVKDNKSVKGLEKASKSFKGYVDRSQLYLSIKKTSNNRKEVDHNKKISKARGVTNAKTRVATKTTNSDVLVSLKKKGFNIFLDTFKPNKNSQTEWNNIKIYLLSKDVNTLNRLGNGAVAFVRNYMDRQTWKNNKKGTIKEKGFDKYGIDSRQLQDSIGYEFGFIRRK